MEKPMLIIRLLLAVALRVMLVVLLPHWVLLRLAKMLPQLVIMKLRLVRLMRLLRLMVH